VVFEENTIKVFVPNISTDFCIMIPPDLVDYFPFEERSLLTDRQTMDKRPS
jgi:hypothetical protein